MSEKKTTPPATPPVHIGIHHVVLGLAMLLFAWRAFDYFVPGFFGIADEHGYLTTAKELATTGHFALHQPDPYAFVGETMMQHQSGGGETYYLRQPMGFPILCAAAYFLGGPVEPFVVNPLCGLALIFGIYVLGRLLKNELAGAITALVVAAHPVLLYYTIKPLSHVADMAVGVWLMVAALAWRRDQKLSQAVLVGLAFGGAVMIRYTNVLLVLPLLVVLWDSRRLEWKKLAGHVGAASALVAVAAACLMTYHAAAFGGVFKTGYSAGGNATSFSLAYLQQHAGSMLECLYSPATGLTVLLIAVAVGAVVMAVRDRVLLLILLAWALPGLVVNTAYYGMPLHNPLLYARFALASYVPLLLVGMCWVSYVGKWRMGATIGVAVLALAAIVWCNVDPYLNATGDGVAADATKTTWNDTGQLKLTRGMCRLMVESAKIVQSKAPPGSVILADNHSEYFLDYVDQYTIYSPEMFDPEAIKRRVSDLDRYPHEFDPERTRQIKDLVGDRDTSQLDEILRGRFRQYLGIPRPVYVFGTEAQVAAWKQRLKMPMAKVAGNEALQLELWEVGAR